MASALTTPVLIGSPDRRSCTGFRKKRRMENMCSGQRAGHGSSIFFILHESFDDAAHQNEISVDRLIKVIATAETYGLHAVGLDIPPPIVAALRVDWMAMSRQRERGNSFTRSAPWQPNG